MEVDSISDRFLKDLHNAASLLVSKGEPQLMLELINQLQQESFLEGYKFSIEVLQDNLKKL